MPPRIAAEADPRRRLVLAATEVFARDGYRRATTRDICDLAGANVAAIHYHFGDKAGLYREVLEAPIREFVATSSRFERPEIPLRDALEAFFRAQLEPLLEGADADPFFVILAHEMAEPSGVLATTLAEAIEPHQRALERMLQRHVGAARIDLDIETLAMVLVAMGSHFVMTRQVTHAIRPRLIGSDAAVRRLVRRLAEQGAALVDHERARRAAAAPAAGAGSASKGTP
ncbi:MAG TPA: CerR family C-terminal domain-containing protein [Methylibium sp.]|uniref:TetR/AcrR family transcriptional regulator n=1 Tax=Methylibium sp. TaxID=2067992 RepID=UPI002DB8D22D|nr:CerR family C-terminal domain-containing protein [Methylibium sp.]HEU4458208.1 CerR family C-terminal domain-containing protein [Methylibium sp.]